MKPDIPHPDVTLARMADTLSDIDANLDRISEMLVMLTLIMKQLEALNETTERIERFRRG